ncbi:MAG: aldose 1-epimerase [Polyangiaceae bacterium]|nr:aldose 1-epimerase [Polyangiaceae bacterium]
MSQGVELCAGSLRLEVFPEYGGSIGAFELRAPSRTNSLMRHYEAQQAPSSGALAMSSFPLVPYSNRVLGGSFEFRGRHVRQSPNMLPHEHPLHGHGWKAAWRVAYQSASQLILQYGHAPGEWPWRYSSTQNFQLSGTSLRHTLSVENRSAEPMPAGLGFHPYFECNELTTLRAQLPTIWSAKNFVPQGLVPVSSAEDFRSPKRVSETSLDHCFAGWNGEAEIHWPDRGVRLRVNGDSVCQHAVIYTPKGAPFFCFEPVSHANDAFNLAARGTTDTGMRVLEPGEKLSTTVLYSVDA